MIGYHVCVYLRRCYRQRDGKRFGYWSLVESYRTERGPRQRVVAYLGDLEESGRLGVARVAGDTKASQSSLFSPVTPEWVEVDVSRVRVERSVEFGGAWLGLEVAKRIGLVEFLTETMATGRETAPWSLMALTLVLCRLCDASSELSIAESAYERSALPDLLGIPAQKVNDDRLYRTLDRLLPHKVELERRLAGRMGELFSVEYDLLLYDVTSTYFEGQANGNSQARRGYSRDHRPDCKQVCIALVVSREGLPLGYEVFDGNRNDATTVEEIVTAIEGKYGKAEAIWVMDRGMASEENVSFLKAGGRRYILGTPKARLRRHEQDLVEGGWTTVREGLQVKLCPSPDGDETFILCRSDQRREKEKAMHVRFEERIAEGLSKIEVSCRKGKHDPLAIERRIGRLLGQNSRAAGLFHVNVERRDDGFADLVWSKVEAWRRWAELSEGCYLLRSNVNDWSAEDLWHAYIQLTQAENAFRIHKSDLSIRPVWHQKKERVQAHILVCFLSYVLWKTLAMMCKAAGLGDEPRQVFDAISRIPMVDVVLPTRCGIEIRKRCVARPTEHQAILLQRLGLHLPIDMKFTPV